MAARKLLVAVSVFSLIQAIPHVILMAMALFQWLCLIDFLTFSTTTILINAVYYHNPESCGVRIYIGEYISDLPNQASLLLQQGSYTSFKTLISSCVGLCFATIWIISSCLLLMGASANSKSIHVRWPWIVMTSVFVIVDLVNATMFYEDYRHTSNFNDLLNYIGGIASGFGAFANEIDTNWVSIIMALFYSRFLIFSVVNLGLIISVLFECKNVTNRVHASTSVSGELNRDNASTFINMTPGYSIDNEVEMPAIPLSPATWTPSSQRSPRIIDEPYPTMTIPRPEFSYRPLTQLHTEREHTKMLQPIEEVDENVASRSENTTTGERSGAQRGLASHLPWAYIKPSGQPMRTILRPEEDLPPVPLQDYTVTDPQRKFYDSSGTAVFFLDESCSSRGHIKQCRGGKRSNSKSGGVGNPRKVGCAVLKHLQQVSDKEVYV